LRQPVVKASEAYGRRTDPTPSISGKSRRGWDSRGDWLCHKLTRAGTNSDCRGPPGRQLQTQEPKAQQRRPARAAPSLPEASRSADLVQELLARQQHAAQLLERNRQLRQELSSIFLISERMQFAPASSWRSLASPRATDHHKGGFTALFSAASRRASPGCCTTATAAGPLTRRPLSFGLRRILRWPWMHTRLGPRRASAASAGAAARAAGARTRDGSGPGFAPRSPT
jgi:hypothetical protein